MRVPSQNPETAIPADASFQAGQLVGGRYRIERLLGVGGMAAVWSGSNERTGKRVALKVILRSLATTPAARDLFNKEGLLASMVNHPNVVTIFDVIEHEGMACIVMELLEGQSLQRHIDRRGALPVQEALALLLPAMRGVAAAHAQGVIHRDLKPQNIFVCAEPNGRVLTTKVLDFGISVLVDRVLDGAAGPFVGTPNYMSPEHVADLPAIDGRVDVYGFGLLLYEALTGQLAFPGEPGPALFDAIMGQPAPSVASLRPDVSPAIVGIVEKALAKRPEDRFSNLHEMIVVLESEVDVSGLVVLTPNRGSGTWEQAAPNQQQDTQLSHVRSAELPTSDGAAPRTRKTADVVVTLTSGFYPRHPRKRPALRLSWKSGLVAASGVVLGAMVWTIMMPTRSASPGQSLPSAGAAQGRAAHQPLRAFEPMAVSPVAKTTLAKPSAPSVDPPMATREEMASGEHAATSASGVRTRQSTRDVPAGVSRTTTARRGIRSDPAPADLRRGAAARRPTRAGSLSVSDF